MLNQETMQEIDNVFSIIMGKVRSGELRPTSLEGLEDFHSLFLSEIRKAFENESSLFQELDEDQKTGTVHLVASKIAEFMANGSLENRVIGISSPDEVAEKLKEYFSAFSQDEVEEMADSVILAHYYKGIKTEIPLSSESDGHKYFLAKVRSLLGLKYNLSDLDGIQIAYTGKGSNFTIALNTDAFYGMPEDKINVYFSKKENELVELISKELNEPDISKITPQVKRSFTHYKSTLMAKLKDGE